MSVNSGAIRRIQREFKEITENPSKSWVAAPANDDLFEWMFTVRGPAGSDFEGGLYHGRIVLPVNYPFAPPSIMLLNPNGRFETNKKICLSISDFHPELWQPAWGIRTMLEALRSFFPSAGDGAIGSLDWPSDLRKKLAKESLEWESPVLQKKLVEMLPPLAEGEVEDAPDVPPEALNVPLAGQPGSKDAAPDGASVPVPDTPPPPGSPDRPPAASPSPLPGVVSPSPAPAPAPVQPPAPAAVQPQPPAPRESDNVPMSELSTGSKATRRSAPKQVPIMLQLIRLPRTPLDIAITVADLLALFFFGAICVLLFDIVFSSPPHQHLMLKK